MRITCSLTLIGLCCAAALLKAQYAETYVYTDSNGLYRLTQSGASYFARLSLNCTEKKQPHTLEHYNVKDKDPSHYWPSFYGCYDWHSAVHNHWALLKLYITHPNLPEADKIRQKLNTSFSEQAIAEETAFFERNEEGWFEFPYGQAWLLKIADELHRWNHPQGRVWLSRLNPLIQFIEAQHVKFWSAPDTLMWSGSHDSPALGMSFAWDYAVSFKNTELQQAIKNAAVKRYGNVKSLKIELEPDTIRYDFMSAGFLVADLMRKIKSPVEFQNWLQVCEPELFNPEGTKKRLAIQYRNKHDGMEAHYDGYYLNRIWCMNGLLKALPIKALNFKTRQAWVNSMNAMWNYAQKSIGIGNYDIDHWLSSFSVFAVLGYEYPEISGTK